MQFRLLSYQKRSPIYTLATQKCLCWSGFHVCFCCKVGPLAPERTLVFGTYTLSSFFRHSDRRIAAALKRKVVNTVVKPSMMYGLEMVGLTQREEVDEDENVWEWPGGTDLVSQYVSGTVPAKHFGDSVSKARGDGLDMCNGGDSAYTGQRMWNMELAVRMRKTSEKVLEKVVIEDMQRVDVMQKRGWGGCRWRAVVPPNASHNIKKGAGKGCSLHPTKSFAKGF